MIVPVTVEGEWLSTLSGLADWTPQAQSTVVIAPHPDDETLAAGGLIARLREAGCEVTVIAVTDGENCYEGENLGQQRSLEQMHALAALGVDERHIYRLRLPDSGLTACEIALEKTLTELVPAGVHLIAPWDGDFHPDHEACGRAAQKVAKIKSVMLTQYFFWTWHRGTAALLEDLQLRRLCLTPDQQALKLKALACHRSQLAHPSGMPILPENLLGPARRDFEVYLPA